MWETNNLTYSSDFKLVNSYNIKPKKSKHKTALVTHSSLLIFRMFPADLMLSWLTEVIKRFTISRWDERRWLRLRRTRSTTELSFYSCLPYHCAITSCGLYKLYHLRHQHIHDMTPSVSSFWCPPECISNHAVLRTSKQPSPIALPNHWSSGNSKALTTHLDQNFLLDRLRRLR